MNTTENRQTQIQNLRPGQGFLIVFEDGRAFNGRLIYANSCRAYVELLGTPTKREFVTANGETVSFTNSGNRKVSWAPECLVEAEP